MLRLGDEKNNVVTTVTSEWNTRIFSLPDVISDVVTSATKGLRDQWSISRGMGGVSKAKQTIYKINHGEDFPLGHKKTVAVA